MGLFNHFPYTDTHQLNLDWMLDAVRGCVDKVAELWTYVREPGAGIQKALTDAQAAATNAQASSANARTSAIGAEANAANAQTSANDAQEIADLCASYLDDMQTMMRKLYPVGAVYVNFRDQTLPAESDATVIARLQALTGGTWARAGSHGQPVQAPGKLGWATVILGDGAGQANDTNFNIYVRTA